MAGARPQPAISSRPAPGSRRAGLTVTIFLGVLAFHGSPVFAQTRLHPAVVRVIVQDRAGRSHGSGALVAVTASHGLVLTNWHVVRDAAAPPTVVFPDGFQSAATIARVDRDWDLAALVIWRPRASPIPLAETPPRPGEMLAIAGYGQGQYRVATGQCTQYLSPGRRHPFELVELAASARQGDSGGPIFNDRGELAGVLFGSAFGRTTGSHSGRVRQFLGPLWNDFYQTPAGDTMIAGRPQLEPPAAAIHGVRPVIGPDVVGGTPATPPEPAARSSDAVAAIGRRSQAAESFPAARAPRPQVLPPAVASEPGVVAAVPGPHGGQRAQPGRVSPEQGDSYPSVDHASQGRVVEPWAAAVDPASARPEPPRADSIAPLPSRSDQLRTILAAIGILALVFHGVWLLGRVVEV